MPDFNNLRVISTIRPSNIAILSIHIEVDILVGPVLVIRNTKLNIRIIGAIITQWEHHNVEPFASTTHSHVTLLIFISRVEDWFCKSLSKRYTRI